MTWFLNSITQFAGVFLFVSLHLFQDSDKSWNCSVSGSPIKIIASLGLFYLAVVNNINSDQFRVKALLGKCIHTLSFIIINLNILFARNFLSENLNSND